MEMITIELTDKFNGETLPEDYIKKVSGDEYTACIVNVFNQVSAVFDAVEETQIFTLDGDYLPTPNGRSGKEYVIYASVSDIEADLEPINKKLEAHGIRLIQIWGNPKIAPM